MDDSSCFWLFMFSGKINIFRDATKERKAPATTEGRFDAYKVEKTSQKHHLGVFL
jgi:hypothetical protein